MKNWIIAGWWGLACLGMIPLSAQEAPAFPQAGTEHQRLHRFEGEWTTLTKSQPGPNQPSVECAGTLRSQKLGEFWILNELKVEMNGVPLKGIQTIGYDLKQKAYVGSWVDSMTDYLWTYKGSFDAAGKVLTLEADGPNLVEAGKMARFQDIYEFKSDDELIMTSRMQGSDGQWITFMNGTATRKT